MTWRHLVGMASIFQKDEDTFENGLAELVIRPHSVNRVSERNITIITLINKTNSLQKLLLNVFR